MRGHSGLRRATSSSSTPFAGRSVTGSIASPASVAAGRPSSIAFAAMPFHSRRPAGFSRACGSPFQSPAPPRAFLRLSSVRSAWRPRSCGPQRSWASSRLRALPRSTTLAWRETGRWRSRRGRTGRPSSPRKPLRALRARDGPCQRPRSRRALRGALPSRTAQLVTDNSRRAVKGHPHRRQDRQRRRTQRSRTSLSARALR